MRHFYLFLNFLLFLGLSWNTAAQVSSEELPRIKQISISYGQTYNIKLDKTYSRLSKKGFNNSFQLNYDNWKNNHFFGIHGDFMTGILHTTGNDINQLTTIAGSITIKYLTLIKSLKTTRRTVYGGINIGTGWDIWFPKTSRLRYGWDINTGLGGSISLNYKINHKIHFQYDSDLFLLGILWRSHNNGQQLVTEETQLEKGTSASAFETPRFAYPINAFYWDNSFKLIYRSNGRFEFYYNLLLSYKHLQQPVLKKAYELGNLIGVTYNF